MASWIFTKLHDPVIKDNISKEEIVSFVEDGNDCDFSIETDAYENTNSLMAHYDYRPRNNYGCEDEDVVGWYTAYKEPLNTPINESHMSDAILGELMDKSYLFEYAIILSGIDPAGYHYIEPQITEWNFIDENKEINHSQVFHSDTNGLDRALKMKASILTTLKAFREQGQQNTNEKPVKKNITNTAETEL